MKKNIIANWEEKYRRLEQNAENSFSQAVKNCTSHSLKANSYELCTLKTKHINPYWDN